MKELWFSIDVETNGAVPGLYDLVSIGACVINGCATKQGGAENECGCLREAHLCKCEQPKFYVVVQPHGGLVDPEAQAVHKITEDERRRDGVDPTIAIVQFTDWAVKTAGEFRPVFCSWGTFDWMWCGYYLEKYGKRYTYPFGPNSLDLKSYYLGLTKGDAWRTTAKGRMPKEDLCGKHTHNALDDAVEQAEMCLKWQKKYGGSQVDYASLSRHGV